MPEYGEKLYWDNRYDVEDDEFDWLCDWDQLEPTITPLIRQTTLYNKENETSEEYISSEDDEDNETSPNKNNNNTKQQPRILVIGCGNAPFSADMYYQGEFTNLINIDYSEIVIIKQKQKWPNMAWVVMDALDMDFADDEFDIILDKSLIDTTMCYKSGKDSTSILFNELHRVLKPGGRLITISLHSEKEVIPFAEECNFAYTTCKLHNKKRINEELTTNPRILYHTFAVFDKIDGLQRADELEVLAQHPITIVNSVTDFVDDSLYDETAYIVNNVDGILSDMPTSLVKEAEKDNDDDDEKKLDILKDDVDSVIHTIDSNIKDLEKLNKMCNISSVP